MSGYAVFVQVDAAKINRVQSYLDETIRRAYQWAEGKSRSAEERMLKKSVVHAYVAADAALSAFCASAPPYMVLDCFADYLRCKQQRIDRKKGASELSEKCSDAMLEAIKDMLAVVEPLGKDEEK